MTVRNLMVAATLTGTSFAPLAMGPGVGSQGEWAANLDIPARALDAYQQAATSPDACPGLDWAVLAGVYARESNHGRYGGATIAADGTVAPAIRNSESGAMGPGQFMPSSWRLFGVGGDPDNIDDAARASVRHLCGTHGDLEGDHLRSAIASYYGADVDGYADAVLSNIDLYRSLGGTFPMGNKTEPRGSIEDGLTLRVADRLLYRTYQGWKDLAGWATGHNPDAAPVVNAADAAIDRLVTPDSSGSAPNGNVPSAVQIDGVVCPVTEGAYVLDGWGSPRSGGRSHQGADLGGTYGSPVVSPFEGIVVQVVNDPATAGLGGLAVWIEATAGPHRGVWVYLAHNERNVVTVGQHVTQGQQVAVLGDSGNAAGTDSPHVHAQWHPAGGGPVPAIPLEHVCQEVNP